MKKLTAISALASVWAGELLAGNAGGAIYQVTPTAVPEVTAAGSVAALGAVAAVSALVWERKRNRRD